MTIVQSIIIAIVEGLTEFLPISSTGHMIIAEKLMNVTNSEFTKVFTVAIQLGAILAVVVLYWRKFFDPKDFLSFYLKLIVGVIPALLLGFLFSDKIDELLESATTVAIALIAGGIILLFIERFFKNPTKTSVQQVGVINAVVIGFWQCLAMVPGVSRSAASIVGGMQQRLTREAASEFSFFLAVPTMIAATGYKLLKHYKTNGGFSSAELQLLGLGNLIAFLVSILAIKFFIGFIKKYGFKVWGIYRIVVGIALLFLIRYGFIAA